MKKDTKRKAVQSESVAKMIERVKIPEALAPTPINPAIDEANQLNIPRNPGSGLYGLDWDVPDEPLVTDARVPATPNPHTNPREDRKKKQK